MLGDTLVSLLTGAGGTSHTLLKINQDAYGAEYLGRFSGYNIRAKIRHSSIPSKNGSMALDRHNVVFTVELPTTPTAPAFNRSISVTITNSVNDTNGMVNDIMQYVNYWMTATIVGKLVGWES